jgi:hypothetical protein
MHHDHIEVEHETVLLLLVLEAGEDEDMHQSSGEIKIAETDQWGSEGETRGI